MTDLNALKIANAKRFALAKITRDATSAASRLVSAKQRYVTVSLKTGVPWFVIAVIHERESSQSWFASLAQGDPWNKVSVHVPAGRGPFQSWEGPRSTRWSTAHRTRRAGLIGAPAAR
jgi:lysozyme family protein